MAATKSGSNCVWNCATENEPRLPTLRRGLLVDGLALRRLREGRRRDVGRDPLGVGLVGDEDVPHLERRELREVRLIGVAERRLVQPLLHHRLLHCVHQEQARGERLHLGARDAGVGQLRLQGVGAP